MANMFQTIIDDTMKRSIQSTKYLSIIELTHAKSCLFIFYIHDTDCQEHNQEHVYHKVEHEKS